MRVKGVLFVCGLVSYICLLGVASGREGDTGGRFVAVGVVLGAFLAGMVVGMYRLEQEQRDSYQS